MVDIKKREINKTSNKNSERIYFPELDGLRFFAFILVFIHHQDLFLKIPYLRALDSYGWVGVDLFFVLSAFLFTKLLTSEYTKTQKISFKKFYIRRIFRIWPVFFVFIGFSIGYFIFITDGEITKNITIRIIGLFAFADNIIAAIKGYNPLPYTLHLWTIAYEEQFYFFIPVIILLLVRSTLKTKIVSFISVLVLFTGVRHYFILKEIQHPAIYVLPVTHFESIILGIVIGFGGFDFLVKKIKPMLLLLIGILIFSLVSILPNVETTTKWLHITYICVGIFTSFTLVSVLNSDLLRKIFSLEVFVFLGKRSYGLYVFHLLGNGVGGALTKHLSGILSSSLASFFYSLFFTIIVSIISYEIIEKPFLKLKKKFEIISSRPI